MVLPPSPTTIGEKSDLAVQLWHEQEQQLEGAIGKRIAALDAYREEASREPDPLKKQVSSDC